MVFQNRVRRKILGPKRDEVTGECRRLHTEELHDLYSSPNITGVIKYTRMRWAGHAAHMGEGEVHTRFMCGDPMARGHLEDAGEDGRIILIRIFKKWDGKA
jgi:hypothetical protein